MGLRSCNSNKLPGDGATARSTDHTRSQDAERFGRFLELPDLLLGGEEGRGVVFLQLRFMGPGVAEMDIPETAGLKDLEGAFQLSDLGPENCLGTYPAGDLRT